jgi:hypothetical protein
MQNDEDFETIRERILENDESIRKAEEFIRGHPVLDETVLDNSVRGVVDFVHKYGSVAP